MASVTNLTNQRIADSYVQLIHTGDDGGLGSSALTLYDGDGTASGLKLSTGGIELEDSNTIKLGTGTDLQIYHDGSNSFITNSTGILKIATETSGIAVTIGHTTSETTIADNLTITGNASVGGNLVVTGTTTFNGGTLTLGDANTDNIVFGGEVDSNIIPDDDNTYDLGSSSKEWKDLYVDGVAYVDAINFNGTAISSTAAELNIVDGGTSATSTTIADADRVVLNDNGTMVQVAVTDLAAYFDDEITAMPNLVTTAATSVGALNSGSITSGFGTIDTGSSAITTTGLISGGSLDIDNVLINGSTIGHTDDTDLITLADGIATIAGEISVTTLDIGGTNVTSTAAELNLLDGVSGLVQADFTKLASIDASATEINILDGDTSASSTTIADADRVIVNDNGTMKQVAVTDLSAYFDDEITAMPNLVSTGALNSGSITSGFTSIDIGSGALSTTGSVTLGATSFGDNNITNVGDIALDSISADGTDINIAVSDNSATAFTIKQGSDAYLIIDTANSSESVAIGTGISGTSISIGHSTSEVTINDNLTITGDLKVNGDTITQNVSTMTINDPIISLQTADDGANLGSDTNKDVGLAMFYHNGSSAKTAFLGFDDSDGKLMFVPDASISSEVVSGSVGTIKANLEGTINTASQTNITSVGTLGAGAISSGFGAIDIGSSNLTATGTISLGGTSFNDNDLTNIGDISADSISSDGSTFNIAMDDNQAGAFTIKESSNSYITLDTTNSSEKIQFHKSLDIDATSDFGSNAMTNVNIDSGSIDGTDVTIGSSKTLDVSSGTLTLANDQISGDKVSGGTIGSTTITALAGDLSLGDNAITNVGDVALDSISADNNEIDITLTDNQATALEIKESTNAYLTFVTTNSGEKITLGKKLEAGSVEIEGSAFDINGGNIDGATIATSDITIGSGKTLDVSGGTLTLANDQISGDKITGGTIGSVTITALAGNISVGDNNITNVGDISLDTISSDAGTSIGVTLGTDAGDDFNVGSGKLVVEGDTSQTGINTATPTEKLEVNGGIIATNSGNRSSGEGIVLDYVTGSDLGRISVGDWGTAYEELQVEAEKYTLDVGGSGNILAHHVTNKGSAMFNTDVGVGRIGANVVSVADDATIALTDNDGAMSHVYVYERSGGGGAIFEVGYPIEASIKTATSSGGLTFDDADTDGAVCVFSTANNHAVTFKNRTGATRNFRIMMVGAGHPAPI